MTLIAIMSLALAAADGSSELYVGVIDDIWAALSKKLPYARGLESAANSPNQRCLSTVFVKDEEGWRDYFSASSVSFPQGVHDLDDIQTQSSAFDHWHPEERRKLEADWTIVSGDRKIGKIRAGVTVLPQCRDHLPITVKQTESTYLGWYSGDSRRIGHRPVVAVAGPYHGDPEHWKIEKLSSESFIELVTAWRSAHKQMFWCPSTPDVRVPLDSDRIQLLAEKTYVSRNGARLIFLKPTTKHGCEGVGPEWAVEAYFWPSGKEPRLIGPRLYPVDAGDFDGDGKSEWLVFASIGEHDGYVLFFDDFQRSVTSMWSYH